MSKEFSPDHAMKGVLWEEAKGKLRALVAVHGSYFNCDDGVYTEADGVVEAFIKEFEGDGLHE